MSPQSIRLEDLPSRADDAVSTRNGCAMPLLRRFSSLVALITTALLAGCGIQPPPDPDATSPDRLPIVVPFDFSKAGNSVEVDFRVIDMQRFRMSNTVYFGYLFIVPDTPDGSRNIDALSLASRSTQHPLRVGLYRIDVAHKPALQLYISAPPSTPDEHNGPMIPVPNARPHTRGTGKSSADYYAARTPGTLLWETRHFALAPELAPGRYRLRVEALTADSALSQHTQLIIYHLRQPK